MKTTTTMGIIILLVSLNITLAVYNYIVIRAHTNALNNHEQALLNHREAITLIDRYLQDNVATDEEK